MWRIRVGWVFYKDWSDKTTRRNRWMNFPNPSGFRQRHCNVNGSVSQISDYRVWGLIPISGVHPPPFPLAAGFSSRSRVNRAPTFAARGRAGPVSRRNASANTHHAGVCPSCVSDRPLNYSVSIRRCVPSIGIARIDVGCEWTCLAMGIMLFPRDRRLISRHKLTTYTKRFYASIHQSPW